jgi:mannosyltransferase
MGMTVAHAAGREVAGRLIRHEYLLLAAVTLLAAGLRFYRLGEWSFWIDEIITVTASAYIADWPLTRLPLNLVFTRVALELFGTAEWSARLAPALAGVLAVPALYVLSRRLFGPAVALTAAVFLALSPWHLFWSQNARFYTLLLLFYNAGLLLFLISWREKRPVYALLGFFLLVVAARERSTAFFFVPVLVAYLAYLWLTAPGRQLAINRRLLLPMFGLVAAFGVYDLSLMLLDRDGSLTASIWRTFVGSQNQNPLRLALSIAFQIGAPLLCLAAVGGLSLLRPGARGRGQGAEGRGHDSGWIAAIVGRVRRVDPAVAFVVTGAVLPPLLLVLLSLFMFTVDRYVFMTLPFWCLLAALALKALAGSHGRRLAAALLLVLVLISVGQLVLYYQFQNGNRPAWRQAMAVVAQRWAPGDRVLSTTPRVAQYYLGDEVRDINNFQPQLIQSHQGRTWFIIDDSLGWVKPALHDWIRQNATLVEVLDVALPGKSLAIRVYLYEPGWF